MPFILQRAIDLALTGDKSMIKFLLDFHLSKPSNAEDDNQAKDKITINIRDLTLGSPEVKVTTVIEGEIEST